MAVSSTPTAARDDDRVTAPSSSTLLTLTVTGSRGGEAAACSSYRYVVRVVRVTVRRALVVRREALKVSLPPDMEKSPASSPSNDQETLVAWGPAAV